MESKIPCTRTIAKVFMLALIAIVAYGFFRDSNYHMLFVYAATLAYGRSLINTGIQGGKI